MIKLLIADDEEYTRDGLMEGIDWEKLGINDVMQAQNGAEALSIAKWYQPDIILTDIKMPKMDGIAFANELYQIKPDIRIIFMSGYMEVEYLKSAIQLCAIDYIEKPIDLKNVEKAIGIAVQSITEQKAHENVIESQKGYQQQQLMQLLSSKNGEVETVHKLCAALDYPTRKNYVCIMLFDKTGTFFSANPEDKIKTTFQQKQFQALCLETAPNTYQILVAYDEKDAYRMQGAIVSLMERFESVVIGVGFEAKNLAGVYNSYTTACVALNRSFYDDESRFFKVGNNILLKKNIDPHIYGDFLLLLKENPAKLKSWCEEFFVDIRSKEYYRKEQIYSLCTSMIISILEEYPVIASEYMMGKSESEIEKEIRSFHSLTDVKQYFMRYILAIEEYVDTNQRYSRLVSDIMEYVATNYSNSDFGVADVGDHFSLTASYVSVLFKQETGVTLKKYISNVKLENAKKLLRDRYIRIGDIAKMCGYANSNYFSKVFREEMNMSPLEYRNLQEK